MLLVRKVQKAVAKARWLVGFEKKRRRFAEKKSGGNVPWLTSMGRIPTELNYVEDTFPISPPSRKSMYYIILTPKKIEQ